MSVIDDLAALQAQDGLIRELEQQVKDIPIRKAQELDRLKLEEESLEFAKEAVRSVTAEIEQAKLDIQVRQEGILKLKQQQMTLKTNKEFAAMTAEIRQAEIALQNAEYDVAARENRLAAAGRAEQESQAKYDAAKAGVDGYVAELDARFAEATGRLDAARAERARLREPLDVPAARRFLMYYERLSRNRWPALVKLKDSICSGCLMALPPAKLQAVRRATDLVTCDFCGRLVY
ncbi:MAG: hypothetical protein GX608_00245 [Lentisphaerae bacterium]|nr:hypothetical protein [Lentisphaerota bacterium]